MDADETTTAPEEKLDTWAIIELFGHSRIAGKVTNVAVAGCGFIRVDVPEYQGRAAYTRHIAPKAVYAINPCDEAAARAALAHVSESPVNAIIFSETYQKIREELKQQMAEQPRALPPSDSEEPTPFDDDED